MSSDCQKLDRYHMISPYHKRSILGQPEGRAVLIGHDFGLETVPVEDSVVFSKPNECQHCFMSSGLNGREFTKGLGKAWLQLLAPAKAKCIACTALICSSLPPGVHLVAPGKAHSQWSQNLNVERGHF